VKYHAAMTLLYSQDGDSYHYTNHLGITADKPVTEWALFVRAWNEFAALMAEHYKLPITTGDTSVLMCRIVPELPGGSDDLPNGSDELPKEK
jgi:hypothetical protein